MAEDDKQAESAPLEEDEKKGNAAPFTDEATRREFLLCVFGVQMCQLAVTFTLSAVILFVDPMLGMGFPLLCAIFGTINILLLIVLAFCDSFRRTFPLDLVMMAVYAIVQGIAFGSFSAYTDGLVIATGISASVLMALTIFCLRGKVQFGYGTGILVVVVMEVIGFSIACAIFQSRFDTLLLASLGATAFGIFIVLDAMMMVNGVHSYALSSDEFIFAALDLHLDIVNIIRCGIGMLVAKICH